jgi:hypothetical protein
VAAAGPQFGQNLRGSRVDAAPDAERFRRLLDQHAEAVADDGSAGIAALHAALGLYLEAGPARCEKRVLDLSTTLADELASRHPYFQYQIARINLEMGKLDQARLALRELLERFAETLHEGGEKHNPRHSSWLDSVKSFFESMRF